MSIYGYKDDLSAIIGHFSNFNDVSDYINNFNHEHQYQYTVVNPKLGVRIVQINKKVLPLSKYIKPFSLSFVNMGRIKFIMMSII
jgi:hypothetical protein